MKWWEEEKGKTGGMIFGSRWNVRYGGLTRDVIYV